MLRLATIAFMLGASMAYAQGQCAAKADMRKVLAEKHGEIPYSVGVTNGAIIEVWANPKTGSWTVLRTIPAGIACIIASGGNFETTKEARAFLGQRL